MDKFSLLFKLGMDRDIGTPLDPIPLLGVTQEGDLLKEHEARRVHLNVGAGNKVIVGAIPLDYPEWDADKDPISYANESVDVITAYHFLEHCADPVKVLLEFQRVLKPGGYVNIVVPYYSAQMQTQDLDHKSAYCEETWRVLFANPYYNKNLVEWKFKIHFNLIAGMVERNLALFTQLVKEA